MIFEKISVRCKTRFFQYKEKTYFFFLIVREKKILPFLYKNKQNQTRVYINISGLETWKLVCTEYWHLPAVKTRSLLMFMFISCFK